MDTELEKILFATDEKEFPPVSHERGEIKYVDRYISIRRALQPIHANVEKGALANSLKKYVQEVRKSQKPDDAESIINNIPVIYLNNHGHGHVERVIDRVYSLLSVMDVKLSAYELFILLCAIQVHDVGNIFGREEHEKTLRTVLSQQCSPYIKDSPERKLIEKIASAHGGTYNGNKDTIGLLQQEQMVKEQTVRCRLLASLLRFADEIADDLTRADLEGIKMGTIPNESLLFHYYSLALHTVKIEKDSINGSVFLNLVFDYDSDVAIKKFDKFGKEVYLLDEIYERTKKMELERRYCTRFMRPYIDLDRIKVCINISDSEDIFHEKSINYDLFESGYPNSECIIESTLTGEELKNLFIKEGAKHE